jgi:hypothetical protein
MTQSALRISLALADEFLCLVPQGLKDGANDDKSGLLQCAETSLGIALARAFCSASSRQTSNMLHV